MRAILTALLLVATLTSARAKAPVPLGAPLPPPTTEAEASTLYEEARKAYKAGEFLTAARAFDAANAWFSEPTLLWNAGRAWERAGEPALARDRFQSYLATPDLEPTVRTEAESALARVLAALQTASRPDPEPAPPAPSAPITGYVVLGTGSALAIGGLILGLVGQGDLDTIRDAQSSADGAVTDLTRQEALDLEDRGTTLRTVGIVTGVVGVATAVTGLVMVLTDGPPKGEGYTGVTFSPRSGGLELGWATRF